MEQLYFRKMGNWDKWTKLRVVALTDAIPLAYGICPDTEPMSTFDWNETYPYHSEWSPLHMNYVLTSTYLMALGDIELGDLDQIPKSPIRIRDVPYVELRKFGLWLKKRYQDRLSSDYLEALKNAGGAYPDAFKLPRPFELICSKQPRSKSWGISLEMPYENSFMRILASMMSEHYCTESLSGRNEGVKAESVALDLDKAMGWTNSEKGKKASRASGSIVAALNPKSKKKC